MKKEIKAGDQITISGRQYVTEKAERCSCKSCEFYRPGGCGQDDTVIASCISNDIIFKIVKP